MKFGTETDYILEEHHCDFYPEKLYGSRGTVSCYMFSNTFHICVSCVLITYLFLEKQHLEESVSSSGEKSGDSNSCNDEEKPRINNGILHCHFLQLYHFYSSTSKLN